MGRVKAKGVLAIAIAFCLALAACGGDDGDGGADSPEAVAEAFLTAAADGDVEKACEYGSEGLGSDRALECEDIASVIEFTPLEDGEAFKTVEESDGEATVEVTTKSGAKFEMLLVDEDGWKVEYIDTGSV